MKFSAAEHDEMSALRSERDGQSGTLSRRKGRRQTGLVAGSGRPSCPVCCETQGRTETSYLGRGQYRSFEYEYLACAVCGSLFVHPMPDQSVLSEMYGPDYLDLHYSAELDGGMSNSETARELAEAVRLLVSFKPGGRVLDVGCGAGRFLDAARRAGLRPEGYEWQPATAQVAANATGVKVHTGSLNALEAGYDAVHLADVLEHHPKPIDMLLQARRLLAPGGILIVRGPLENQIHIFQQAVRFYRLLRARVRELPPITLPPYHLILFTRIGLHALIGRSGLTVLYERIYEVHWPVPVRFRLSPFCLVKKLSVALSSSRPGRYFHLGNRVCSILGA